MGIFDIVDDFIENPVGTVVDTALQPVHDTLSIIEGLSDGELREQAALRLGADVVGGMATSEVISFLAGE